MTKTTRNIVLLGDQTLDNAAYLSIDPDHAERPVSDFVRTHCHADVLLIAEDDTTIADLHTVLDAQFSKAPAHTPSATLPFAVVSCGINDVITATWNPCDIFSACYWAWNDFPRQYGAMLDAVLQHFQAEHVAVFNLCYVSDDGRCPLLNTLITYLNWCINKEAGSRGVAVLDLYYVSSRPGNMANGITPSHIGGFEMAMLIKNWIYRVENS